LDLVATDPFGLVEGGVGAAQGEFWGLAVRL
jgi:hypothetical protein